MNIFKFRDYYKITLPENNLLTNFNDSVIPEGYRRGLSVRFEATHAAFYNKNRRFYLPSAMEEGSSTFVTKRNKPAKILKHHDGASDPVGIITGEQFIWTIPDELKINKDVQIMMDSSFPEKKQIQAAKNFMKDGYPFQEGWRGLGYIALDAIILDEKTIQQVRNGLFDAVSTSFDPANGGIYCSECFQNLKEDGFCEHTPGKVYEDEEDGKKAPCAWIPTRHVYEECSLVVFDADPLTSVEVIDDTTSEKKIFTFENKSITEDSHDFQFSFKDFKEDAPMAKPNKKLSEIEQKVENILKEFRPDMKDEDRSKLAKDIAKLEKNGLFHKDQEDSGLDEESVIKNIIEDSETKEEQIDADAVYEDMATELEEDKKLSGEARKKLPKSTFCGPNDSFPVPDCAHVTAARRLIGRYKGPGDKTRILACVNRKAKALGCDSKDSKEPEVNNDSVVTMEMPTCDMLKTLEDKQVLDLFYMAEAEGVTRKIKLARECSKCAEADSRAEAAVKDKEEVVKEVEDLKLQLKYLRTELRDQSVEYSALVDENITVRAELTNEKLERLSLVSVLSGKSDSVDSAKEQLKDSDLEEQATVLFNDFDIDKINKKLNDGMDHKPNGDSISNPGSPDEKQGQELLDGLNETQKAIYQNIKNFVESKQEGKARNLYDKMVSMNIINKELLPFEIFLAETQDNTPAE